MWTKGNSPDTQNGNWLFVVGLLLLSCQIQDLVHSMHQREIGIENNKAMVCTLRWCKRRQCSSQKWSDRCAEPVLKHHLLPKVEDETKNDTYLHHCVFLHAFDVWWCAAKTLVHLFIPSSAVSRYSRAPFCFVYSACRADILRTEYSVRWPNLLFIAQHFTEFPQSFAFSISLFLHFSIFNGDCSVHWVLTIRAVYGRNVTIQFIIAFTSNSGKDKFLLSSFEFHSKIEWFKNIEHSHFP